MSYRYRTAFFYLFAEQWYDRTVGAKYIAKPCGYELCRPIDFALLDGLVETLHINLAYTLGTSHDIGGIDRFIGLYQ